MIITGLKSVSVPLVLDCQQFYELMVAEGEGRSPMTSSDAETDSKPIIIIIIIHESALSRDIISSHLISLISYDSQIIFLIIAQFCQLKLKAGHACLV